MIELGLHQREALRKLDSGSVLRGGVGTGKSRAALAFYIVDCMGRFDFNGKHAFKPMARPRDLYIITTAKKRNDREWEGESAAFGMGREPSSNVYGRSVTVDSWNNFHQYVDVKGAFFIFDEQRLVGKGSWVKTFLKVAANNRWILLSATPGDSWLDYIPLFIANGFYKNRTEFNHRHIIYSTYTKFPKVDRFINTGILEKHRRAILVDMPYHRHTSRHISHRMVVYDEAQYQRAFKDRWNVFEDRPIRNITEMFGVIRKIVNSDPSRLGAVMSLFEKHPRLIIFYNFDYELFALRTLATTLNVTVKEWNGHKHEPIPDEEKWMYLVQYTAGNEGWNCITTDTVIFYSLNYSGKVFEQVQGRIDRMNTPYTDLYYYVLRSSAPIDTGIWRAVMKKKKFDEKSFAPLLKFPEPAKDENYQKQAA